MYLLTHLTHRVWPDPIDPAPPAAPPAQWPDPDQPGAPAPAEVPQRRRCVCGPKMPARPAPAAVAPVPAHQARSAMGLCRRKVRWLATGLAAAVGVSLLQALTRQAGVPPAPGPWAGPPEVPKPFVGHPQGPGNASQVLPFEAMCHPDEAPRVAKRQDPAPDRHGPPSWTSLPPEATSTQRKPAATASAVAATTEGPDRARPSAGPAGKATSRLPSKIQALTQAIEAILADEEMAAEGQTSALVELVNREALGAIGLPRVAALGRVVTAYQASRFWRQDVPMQIFISAMEWAIKPDRIRSVHLQQLLRLWHWQWGDCAHTPGTFEPTDGRVPPHLLTWNIVEMLGDDVQGADLLDRLITAITKAPEGMPQHGARWDATMRDHAYWVATAMLQVLTANPFSAAPSGDSETGALQFGQAYRILYIFLQTPATDVRWKPVILRVLEAMVPTDASNQPLMTKAQWETLLLRVTQAHIGKKQPQLPAPSSLDAAITALVDPDAYRRGEIDKTKFKVRFH